MTFWKWLTWLWVLNMPVRKWSWLVFDELSPWIQIWKKLRRHNAQSLRLNICLLLFCREFFPFLDFLSNASPWTRTRHIHHTCLRSAVSRWKPPSLAQMWQPCVKHWGWLMPFPLSSRSNDGLQVVHVFQCCRVAEMDATHRRQEIQVHISTHKPLPLRSLLSCKS